LEAASSFSEQIRSMEQSLNRSIRFQLSSLLLALIFTFLLVFSELSPCSFINEIKMAIIIITLVILITSLILWITAGSILISIFYKIGMNSSEYMENPKFLEFTVKFINNYYEVYFYKGKFLIYYVVTFLGLLNAVLLMATGWFGPIPLQPIVSIFAITVSITASIALTLSRWYFEKIEKIEKIVKQPDQLPDVLFIVRQLEHAEGVNRLLTITLFTILILFLIFSPIFLPITLTSKSVITLITSSLYFSLILTVLINSVLLLIAEATRSEVAYFIHITTKAKAQNKTQKDDTQKVGN